MAYSLNDLYRPLRFTLRLNGVILGCGVGSILLFTSAELLTKWHLFDGGDLWSTRLAGALLITFGILFLLATSERVITTKILIAAIVAHTLAALVLLVAYLQGEFSGLTPVGQGTLVTLFSLCLLGATMPLRYFRAEYRPF